MRWIDASPKMNATFPLYTAVLMLSASFSVSRLAALVAMFFLPLVARLTADEPAIDQSVVDSQGTGTYDQLFDVDRVIQVDIEVDSDDWDQLRFQTRSMLDSMRLEAPESPFTYVHADVTVDGIRIPNVGIRKKGFLGSLDQDRPSLKVRFDKYEDQLPFGALDRLTLNNNKQDSSRLSQYLSYKLFRETGTVASRCNLAHVTVNGESLGVYSNVESIEPPMLQAGFGGGDGTLVEGTVTDLLDGSIRRFEHKDGPDPQPDLARASEILSADALDLQELDKLIDVDAFLRFWAMESLIGFWDGYTHNQNNFFVYKSPADAKYYFLPWGTDSAFTYEVPPIIDRVRHKAVHNQSVLANRMYRDADARRRYRAVLDGFLEEIWDEKSLLAETDRVVEMIRPYVAISESEFDRRVKAVQSFIRSRRSVLKVELDRWPMPLYSGPRTPGFANELGRGKATFDTAWFDKTPTSPAEAGEIQLEFSLDGEPIEFKAAGAFAELGKRKEASLVLTGIRKSDGREFKIVLGFPVETFRSDSSAQGMGVLMEGGTVAFFASMFLDRSSLRLVSGELELDQASTDDGGRVSGSVQFRVMRFAGGKSPRAEWDEE